MEDDTKLARWLSGEMSASELEALQNSPEYPTLVRIRDNFTRLKSPEFDSGAILGNVLRHEKTPVKALPLYRKTWVRAAAVIVVLLGVSLAFFAPKHEVAANRETTVFALPDDSEVVLNAGSEATYSTWGWSARREVSLKGEAYFKVAKGKKFSVRTHLGTVTVLGTKFNVRARENRFDVVCYEGRVRVELGARQFALARGQSVSITNGTAELIPAKASEPAWMKGELVFSKEYLPGLIAEIERQYDVKIKADIASAQQFSGSLPGNDLDTALKIVSLTYHLKVNKTPNVILLTPVDAAP